MTSLSAMFKEAAGPYSPALKVSVVAAENTASNYVSKDGEKRASLSCAVSDGETVVLLVCYDSSKFSKLKIGATVVLRNVIRKKERSNTIVVTSASRVFISSPLDVPEDHQRIGEQLINPPPAEQVKISCALSSPVKRKVSICGKVVQEDESRQVTVRGESVKIKTVTVEDKSGQAKVTLWRTAAESPVRPGSHISITDVVVNIYNNKTSLSTTMKSKVEMCEVPEEELSIIVDALDVCEDSTELLLETEDIISVSTEMLSAALVAAGYDANVEEATINGPLDLTIKKGSEVTEIRVNIRDI